MATKASIWGILHKDGVREIRALASGSSYNGVWHLQVDI